MSTTNTPNMTLPVPGVGTEPGPQYAIDVNDSLNIIDRHDHTPGSGVAITPSAIDINSALTFAGNFATNVAGVTFTAQGSTPAPGTIYESDVDLFYVDGDGNVIQITTNGGVAGTPGSITNLTPPASATYVSVSSTFVWQSDTNIAANLDAGSLIMRNLTPNSTFSLTLQPPAAMGANYALTLPSLPLADAFLTIDTSGSIDGSIPTNQGLTTGNYANLSVTTPKIADLAVTDAKIAAATITADKLAFTTSMVYTNFTANGTFLVPAGITKVLVWGTGGGGGGGAGYVTGSIAGPGPYGGGGAGGMAAPAILTPLTVTPGETLSIAVGAAGAGGANVSGPGNPGGNGGDSQVTSSSEAKLFPGGTGGGGGQLPTGGASAGSIIRSNLTASGGNGGASLTNGGAGDSTNMSNGGTGGNTNGGGGGGGGGASNIANVSGGNGGNGAQTIGGGSTPAVAGNPGAANSGGGGGGGGGSAGGVGAAGGAGGTGFVQIIYIANS